MRKRIGFLLLTAACLAVLGGCGAAREPAALPVETADPGEGQPIAEQVTVNGTIHRQDGAAEFTLSIDQFLRSDPLPVVEVVPWDITEEDVERVARAFFPDAVFYERTKQSDPQYTKAQLEYKIALLEELDAEGLKELYGYTDQDTLNLVGRYIQIYTQKLASAPAEEFREANQWKFRKEDYHCDYDLGDKVLCNTTMVDGMPYHVFAFARDKGDYSFNRIYVEVGEGLGLHYEKNQLWAKLCRTPEPTQDQIDAVLAKAEQLLTDMQMGQWAITSWEVQVEEGDVYMGKHTPEYRIRVVARPVVNGVQTLEGQRCYDFQSQEPEASKAMIPDAYFLFSADAVPFYFCLTAPVKEVRVVEQAAATLPMQTLIEKAQTYLGSVEPGGMDLPYNDESFFLMYGENVESRICVTSFAYGLSRRKVPGVDFHYYYVPTLVFYGSAEYYGADSGAYYGNTESRYGTALDDVLWLDARDGTMILME